MDNREFLGRIVAASAIVGAVSAIIDVIVLKERLPFLYGLGLGFAVSALMLIQNYRSLSAAVMMTPEQAQRYIFSRYYLRLGIYVLVIFSSIKAAHINVAGTVIGLLCIKAGTVLLALLKKV